MNRDLMTFLTVFAFVEMVMAVAIGVLWSHAGMASAMVPSLTWMLLAAAVAWLVKDDRRTGGRSRLPRNRKGRKN